MPPYGQSLLILVRFDLEARKAVRKQNADRIAVIDNGTVAACDTHENLLKSCKIYQDIYASQVKKEA